MAGKGLSRASLWEQIPCVQRYFPSLALQTLWTVQAGVWFDVWVYVFAINKGDFPLLLFHFQHNPDQAYQRPFTVAAELWPRLPEPCDIHPLFCFYRAAVSRRIKLRYLECELWVLINLVMLCGLGTARVFPIYDLRVHFVQPVEQLASLWNGYPVNTSSPRRAVTTSYHGTGGQKKVVPVTSDLVLTGRHVIQRKTEVRERRKLSTG